MGSNYDESSVSGSAALYRSRSTSPNSARHQKQKDNHLNYNNGKMSSSSSYQNGLAETVGIVKTRRMFFLQKQEQALQQQQPQQRRSETSPLPAKTIPSATENGSDSSCNVADRRISSDITENGSIDGNRINSNSIKEMTSRQRNWLAYVEREKRGSADGRDGQSSDVNNEDHHGHQVDDSTAKVSASNTYTDSIEDYLRNWRKDSLIGSNANPGPSTPRNEARKE